jgi:hypothetical protein
MKTISIWILSTLNGTISRHGRSNMQKAIWSLGIVTVVGAASLACKKLPNGKSSLESLDNFAAQDNLVTNACKGQDADRNGIIANTLMSKVFPAINPHGEALRDVFSAIPADLAELFIAMEGEIILSSFPERYCDVNRSGSYEIQACYRHVPPNGNQRRILQVVVPADDRHIGHALLRQFGYLVAQELSSPNFSYDSKTLSSAPLASRIRGIGGKKTQVAEAFVNDVMASSFLGNVDSEKLFGGAGNVGMAGGRFSWSQLRMGEAAKTRLSDSIFAEAFDSYYCRAFEPVTDGMVAPFGSKKKMSTEELKAALTNIKNSRVRASLLFTQTIQAMNVIMPEVFEGRPLANASNRGGVGAVNGGRTRLGLIETEDQGLGLVQSDGCDVGYTSPSPYAGAPDSSSLPISSKLNALQNAIDDSGTQAPAESNGTAGIIPVKDESKVFAKFMDSGEQLGSPSNNSAAVAQADMGASPIPEQISYPKLESQSLAGSPQIEAAVSAGLPTGTQSQLFEEKNATITPAQSATSGLALGDSLLTRCIRRTEAAQRLEKRTAGAASDLADTASDGARSAARVADTSSASAVITKGGVIGGRSAKSEVEVAADAIKTGSATDQAVETFAERQAGLEARMKRLQGIDQEIAATTGRNQRSALDEAIDATPNNGQSPLDQAIGATSRNQDASRVEKLTAERAALQKQLAEEAQKLRKKSETAWRNVDQEVRDSSKSAYGVRGELAEVARQKKLLDQAREANSRYAAAYGADRSFKAPTASGDGAKDFVNNAVHDALKGQPAEELRQLEGAIQARITAARDRMTKTYSDNQRELQKLERRMDEYPDDAKSIMEQRAKIEAEQMLIKEKVLPPRNVQNARQGQLLDAIIENHDVNTYWNVRRSSR